MTTPFQPPSSVRRVIVQVVEARDLLPKDGQGSSSPYVMAEFDGQRKRTTTRFKELNPVWNETLEFIVSDPDEMEFQVMEIEVYNDKKYGNGSGRKNQFLGKVKLYGTHFAKRGDETLVFFALERKSVFSWIRGEIGLKIYYYDEFMNQDQTHTGLPPQQNLTEQDQRTKTKTKSNTEPPAVNVEVEEEIDSEVPEPVEHSEVEEDSQSPFEIEESAPPVVNLNLNLNQNHLRDQDQDQPLPEILETHCIPKSKKMKAARAGGGGAAARERARNLKRSNGDDKIDHHHPPPVMTGKPAGNISERVAPRDDLVEPMQYLFVRVLKARGINAPCESPYVKIRTSRRFVRSKPASFHRPNKGSPEWHQVFALEHNNADTTLEISLWDSPTEKFLGGVCFDLSDVPVRDPPNTPLASQWYHLEAGAPGQKSVKVSGDIQLSVWIGTQSDEAFPEAWNSDAPYVAHTRPKVYQSPKLWYLRVNIIEAQDLKVVASNLPPLTTPDIRIKVQLGFQSARTRPGSMNQHSLSFHWNEDLMFVAGEPLEDSMVLVVEKYTTPSKEPTPLGHTLVQLSSIERRVDERRVASKWFALEGGGSSYRGRVLLRLCLEGGYHVLDEAAHVCSDFRPTAKQLWTPPVGILELGIVGARGLLPMKTKGTKGKGSTDAYCVAKYGKKWVRTRTITDNFDPRWNEQYTWQVFDPCTVITIGVFDNWRMFADVSEEKPDLRIGKVRIRVSTLEANKIYTNPYPLMVLSRTGLKKMGEIELAVRFSCPTLLPDTCRIYGQPLLPRMHYLRPIGVAQQEALRGAATRMVAQWLARSEPPLGKEVVHYMLDSDSNNWSMRKSKVHWFRIIGVIAWAVGLTKSLDNIKGWRNPLTTIFFHIMYIVLVWYPDLIIPTGFLYMVLIGIWCKRFKPRIPGGMDTRLSQAEAVDPDELDEEFDTIPSSKPADVVRMRYDRLRMVAARVQKVLGDVATQGERVQALVSWRDPKATKLFIGVCLGMTLILFVVPTKMVAVALGFYYLRHPMFRDPMPPARLNFFRRLPSLSDRLM